MIAQQTSHCKPSAGRWGRDEDLLSARRFATYCFRFTIFTACWFITSQRRAMSTVHRQTRIDRQDKSMESQNADTSEWAGKPRSLVWEHRLESSTRKPAFLHAFRHIWTVPENQSTHVSQIEMMAELDWHEPNDWRRCKHTSCLYTLRESILVPDDVTWPGTYDIYNYSP